MEILLAILFGVVLAASVFLLLARSLPRMLIGLLLLGNAANLAILSGGRILGTAPPLVPPGAAALSDAASNPLPQALVLTAIVISFGLTAFATVLAWAAYRANGTLDGDALRLAEPTGLPAADAEAADLAEPSESQPDSDRP